MYPDPDMGRPQLTVDWISGNNGGRDHAHRTSFVRAGETFIFQDSETVSRLAVNQLFHVRIVVLELLDWGGVTVGSHT